VADDVMKDSSSHQLLLVDDSASNLDTLLATLGDRYNLRIAIDGQAALDLIATDYLPDLILLDIMMPGLDGYDICRTLKAGEKTRDIPIIFLTALDNDVDEAKGLELGAVDYISKPFKVDEIKLVIEKSFSGNWDEYNDVSYSWVYWPDNR